MTDVEKWFYEVGRLVDEFIYNWPTGPGRLLRIYRTVKDDKNMFVEIVPEEGISYAVPIKVITYSRT